MKTRSRTARSVPLGRGVRGGTGMPCTFPIRAYHHTASSCQPAPPSSLPGVRTEPLAAAAASRVAPRPVRLQAPL